jgi:hypothetical protein
MNGADTTTRAPPRCCAGSLRRVCQTCATLNRHTFMQESCSSSIGESILLLTDIECLCQLLVVIHMKGFDLLASSSFRSSLKHQSLRLFEFCEVLIGRRSRAVARSRRLVQVPAVNPGVAVLESSAPDHARGDSEERELARNTRTRERLRTRTHTHINTRTHTHTHTHQRERRGWA